MRVIPVCARRMGQALAIALKPELYLVIEPADMFVPGERNETLITGRLARFPIPARNDPQVNVIGVSPIRICLREDM